MHLRLTRDQVARRWLHMSLSAAFQGLREHVEVGAPYVCGGGGCTVHWLQMSLSATFQGLREHVEVGGAFCVGGRGWIEGGRGVN